ncbi:MAG: aminodeoxychorismate/anthranilate synthase component II [Planctomycetes bacterium]|nr:aminodeoxychorismate/anthranilate synthase component II [Planctomycetota bacterium]
MIFLIDNYDSFVFNLARYFKELGQDVNVARNTAVTVSEVLALNPQAIVLSPGPCDPERAGVCIPIIRELSGSIPILGVCLGHQAIAAALGGRVARSGHPMHAVASSIHHRGQGIFAGLPSPFTAARYHSLIVDPESLPADLAVTAVARDPWGDTVMAIEHRRHLTIGLQFHPESVLTACGHELLANFLRLAGIPAAPPPREIPQPEVVEAP